MSWGLVAILFVISGVMGCSGSNQTILYQDAGRGERAVVADSCAFGGFALQAGYRLDSLSGVDMSPAELTPRVQAELWTPVLETAFMRRTGIDPAVSWDDWVHSIPEEHVDRILHYQARLRLLPPGLLEEVSPFLPEARYLVLATLLKTTLVIDLYEGLPEHHAESRKVWLQLDVYDLRLHRSIWTSRIGYKGEGPRSPAESSVIKGSGAGEWGSAWDADNLVTDVKSGPPLRPTLDEAMAELFQSFQGAGVEDGSIDSVTD